jgi:hypothetical protein
MISLSTQDLLSLAASHPKEAKALIKTLTTPPSTQAETKEAALQKVPQTVQTLLQALASNQSTPANVKQALDTTAWFKQAPALSTQLQGLAVALQKTPELKSFAAPLENFLKHIATASGGELKSQMQQSGVFLESSLKHKALPLAKNAPLSTALTKLQKQLPSLPLDASSKARIQTAIQTILSSPTIKQSPQGQPLQHLGKTLNETLARATIQAEKRPLFPLAQKVTRLSQGLEALRNQAAHHLLTTKSSAPAVPNERSTQPSLPTPLRHQLQALLTELKTLPLPLPKSNPNQTQSLHASLQKEIAKVIGIVQNVLQSPKSIAHDFTPTLHVKPLPLKAHALNTSSLELKTNIATSSQVSAPMMQQTLLHVTSKTPPLGESLSLHFSTTPAVTASPLAPLAGLELQDKLKLAITTLKTLIQTLDKPTQTLPMQLEQTKTLFDQTKQVLQQTGTPQNDPMKGIADDVKKTLLEIKTSTSPTAHKEIHQLANKTLAQIEMHQLYSIASQSAHTYFPYLWNGLQSGNIMMRSKEDEMHCQIDLEFEHYQKVHMMLVLTQERYVALSIALENPSLKEKISTHIQELRLMLSAVGLVPKAITLLPYEKRDVLENQSLEEDFGVNITV